MTEIGDMTLSTKEKNILALSNHVFFQSVLHEVIILKSSIQNNLSIAFELFSPSISLAIPPFPYISLS